MSDESRGTGPPASWAGGRGRGWAGGRFRSPAGSREERTIREVVEPVDSAPASVDTAPVEAEPPEVTPSVAPARAGAGTVRGTAWRDRAELAGVVVAEWAPVAGRVLLGLVLAWFGYHELTSPGNWTGYVPIINEASNLAIVAVLVHGWVLFVLAIALVAGIAPRVSAAIASVLLLEIVISLSVSGLSDTSMRDVGVLGLAVVLTGCRNQRLVLRG
jgi:uncharacterized membrane protein YphA (DoxX/SURF4 family)